MFNPQNPKYFDKLKDYFKSLEDIIAAVDLAESLLSKAKKTEEPQIIQYFEKQVEQAKTKLTKVLESSGLDKNVEFNQLSLVSHISKSAGWLSVKKERKLIVNQLSQEALKLHKKIKNKEFTDSDIEKGLHKLRRELRWIVVHIAALDGVVKPYNEQKLGYELNNLYYQMFKKNPEIYENKYIQISKPSVLEPLKVPRVELALIAEFVATVGKDKDKAEVLLYLNEAIEKSSLSNQQKETLRLKTLQISKSEKFLDAKQLSKDLQKVLRVSELVKHYAEHLQSMN